MERVHLGPLDGLPRLDGQDGADSAGDGLPRRLCAEASKEQHRHDPEDVAERTVGIGDRKRVRQVDVAGVRERLTEEIVASDR